MATQPTQNPVPSESPRDLKFNAGKIDEVVNSTSMSYMDRLGNKHLTWSGIESMSKEAISGFGYITVDSFEDGYTLTEINEVLRYEASGEYYRWNGAYPKVVSAGSTPDSSGGISPNAWVSVGDASLRSNLKSESGASLVGLGGITVKEALGANVKGIYKAKGDGIADDTEALQKAIDENSYVYLPPGVYRTTNELKVDSKICHIFGAGVGISIIFLDSEDENGLVFDLNYQQGGGVQNLSIASKSLTSDVQHVGSSGVGLYVKNANDNFFCDHFEVIRFGTSVKCRGCYQPRFTNFRFNWFSTAGICIEKYDGTSSSAGNGCLFSTGKISNLGYADGETTPPGIDIQFGSGEFFRDIDIQKTGLSIRVKPPSNSYVRYVWFDNVLADTANADGILLDGGDAEVNSIFFNCCWTSNHVNNGITIKGNNISNVQWRGGTLRGSKNNGVNYVGGKFIVFDGAFINNNSNGNPYIYPGVYVGANTSQLSILNCTIGNLPDSVANLHQGSGIVFESGVNEACRVIGNDLRAYGTGGKPIDVKGSLSGCIVQNNLPLRTPLTNTSNFSTLNYNSYNTISSGQNTYLTPGGVGSLAQARTAVPSGIIIGIIITSSDTPGASQNYAYNLWVNDTAISLGTISNGSYKLISNINTVLTAGDSVALQVLTSSGSNASTHRAVIMISA